MSFDPTETRKVVMALDGWFRSQQIKSSDAAFVCTNYIAFFIAQAAINREQMNDGVTVVNGILLNLVDASFKVFGKDTK